MAPEDVHPERLSGGTDCAAQLTGQAAGCDVTRLHVALHVVAPVGGEAAVETAVAARLCVSIVEHCPIFQQCCQLFSVFSPVRLKKKMRPLY
jgi:hypothetical protein